MELALLQTPPECSKVCIAAAAGCVKKAGAFIAGTVHGIAHDMAVIVDVVGFTVAAAESRRGFYCFRRLSCQKDSR